MRGEVRAVAYRLSRWKSYLPSYLTEWLVQWTTSCAEPCVRLPMVPGWG